MFHSLAATRSGLLRLGGLLASIGAFFILIYLCLFLIPELFDRRKSATWQRRYGSSRKDDKNWIPAVNAQVPPQHAGKEGIALVFVLVLVALISTLVLEAQVSARLVQREQQSVERTQAMHHGMSDAAFLALAKIADDDDLLADSTNDAWYVTEDFTSPQGINFRVVVRDAQQAFDINNLVVQPDRGDRSSGDILGSLFMQCGLFASSGLINGLADWTDPDNDGFRETDFYGQLKPPYKPSNRVLYEWPELLLVDGATPGLLDRKPITSASEAFRADLVDVIEVLPVRRERTIPVNLNTANRDTLIGVVGHDKEALADTILTFRAMKPIRSLEALMLAVDPLFIEQIRSSLDVKSRYFRVSVQAFTDGQSAKLSVLASRDASGQVEIVQWMF